MKKLEKILWSGVYSNDPKKVAFALNLGANINFKSNIDITPLHWATYKINKELVEILISAGADVNAKNNTDIAPLHLAIINDEIDLLTLLISAGADVNSEMGDTFGYKCNVLHFAISIGCRVNIVKLLIEAGVDINAKNSEGKIPLDLARTPEMKTLLIEHGATL